MTPANDKSIIIPPTNSPPKYKVLWEKIIRPLIWKALMPWEIGKPVALPWGGWTRFDAEQKAKYPIRWYLFDTIPDYIGHITYRWNRRIWDFKHKYIPKHQYHIIRTSLEPGYYDPRTLILHSTMDMVKQFVEITSETVAWDADPEHEEAWKELQTVYDWWVHKYPNRESLLPKYPDVDFEKIIGENHEQHDNDPDVVEWRRVSDIHLKAEQVWLDEEEEMLSRIIKVRPFLWYP